MDPALIITPAISAGAGLLGAWLGSRWTAKDARERAEEQWRRDEAQRIQARRDKAAERLQQDLLEIRSFLPAGAGPAGGILSGARRASESLNEAERRSTLLADDEILERLRAFDAALFVLAEHAEEQHKRADGGFAPDPKVNPWPITAGLEDVRRAIDAFLLRRKPPPRVFMSEKEILDLGYDEDGSAVGLSAVAREIRSRRRELAGT